MSASSSLRNSQHSSKISLEELDPLAIHHVTLTAINQLDYEGAAILVNEMLEKITSTYN